jgi:hypothetical protein
MQHPVPSAAPRINSKADGERLLVQVMDLLTALTTVVAEETALVRQGRIAQSVELGTRKGELAGQYFAATERLKANTDFVKTNCAEKLDELKRRHDAVRPLLQTNLTVLATAHAVSEGIIRGVAGEITRKAAPQTYGGSGRAVTPPPNAARPVMLSRTL